MTPEAQLALIAAILPTVSAIGAIVVTVVVHLRAVAKLDLAAVKLATADQKLDHITVLTNSTLSAAMKRIDELEKVIQSLLADRAERRV